jgi:type II secretory pathway component PulJ
MKSPVAMARSSNLFLGLFRSYLPALRPAFTLVEVLVATAITLLMMAGIVTLFGSVSESVSRSQAMMETADRLRATQHRLQTDLKYVTARMVPPLDPREQLGYFEILDGAGPFSITSMNTQPINSENGNATDTTVGDVDDVLMFTARSYGEPFVGRWNGTDAIQSQVAEICWFMRGPTLYRRVLLVVPERTIPASWYTGMYNIADVSVRQEGGNAEPNVGWGSQRLITNSLGDLTQRENRYAHYPRHRGPVLEGYPFGVSGGGQTVPTLRESSHSSFDYPAFGDSPAGYSQSTPTRMDYWLTEPWASTNYAGLVDPATGDQNHRLGPRIAEDVILKNVIGFDVKVWDPYAPVLIDTSTSQVLQPGDPGYRAVLEPIGSSIQNWVNGGRQPNSKPSQIVRLGAYVDLYYVRRMTNAASISGISAFSGPGNPRSQLHVQLPTHNHYAVWDTFSTYYERDAVDQDRNGTVDDANDGLDNDGRNGVDDAGERETAPPYDTPIRSIQIKIRVFERDSRQIREVTVTQDFVP